MAFDFAKFLNNFNPTGKQGNLLLSLNAAGMVFAAISNTYAAATDKNTKAEDKKFLVPAGAVTGAANIILYYTMTEQIINVLKGKEAVVKDGETIKDGIKGIVEYAIEKLKKNKTFDSFADKFVLSKVKAAENGKLFGFGKKSAEYVQSIKSTLLNEAKTGASDFGKKLFENNVKEGAGVLGAFIGAVIGCAILTPIIRDVSAYIVQKRMEKNKPELKDKPYRPYIDPIHSGGLKQPLSMKSYMVFTNSGMKV